MRFKQFTKGELRQIMMHGWRTFLSSHCEGIPEKMMRLIYKSSIDREVFESWDRYSVAIQEREMFQDRLTVCLKTYKESTTHLKFTPYIEKFKNLNGYQQLLDEMALYGTRQTTIGCSLVWDIHKGLDIDFLDDFEMWVQRQWLNSHERKAERENSKLFDVIWDACIKPFYLQNTLVVAHVFRLMEAYKWQYGQNMTSKGFSEIRNQFLNYHLRSAPKSRFDANVDFHHFIFTEDIIEFSRDPSGKLQFYLKDDPSSSTIESFQKDGSDVDFDETRPHIGCPLVNAWATLSDGKEAPYLKTRVNEALDIFQKSIFGLQPDFSVKRYTGCPYHQSLD